MNIHYLSSRFSSRLVALLVIVLIQLPAVTPAFGFRNYVTPRIFRAAPSESTRAAIPLTVFANTTNLTVADRANMAPPGIASLYPSPIVVSAMTGTIADVNVIIGGGGAGQGVTAPRPRDLDLLLVAPTGQTLVLMADAGDLCTITDVRITLDDEAATTLPNPIAGCPPATPITTGSYRPTNYIFGVEVDTFPAPAPAGPYNHPTDTGSATLAVFDGLDPNGTWNLYVVDDSLGGGASTIEGGWSIDITTVSVDPTSTGITSSANPALTTDTITFTSTTTNTATSSPVTTGTVTFTSNTVNIAGCVNVPVNASGQATCMTTLAEGTRTIAANYSGTPTLGVSSGSLTQVVNSPTVVTGAQFCNAGDISIPDPPGVPIIYPSSISVSGMVGTVSTVTVFLEDLIAPRPDNLDFLLVGPNNGAFKMLSDVGDGVNPSNVDLTLSDAAAAPLPQGSAISSGTFRPTDYAVTADTFPPPAPAGPSAPAPTGVATFTTVFGSSNPNGTWRLYSIDDSVGGGTSTLSRWCVTFTLTPLATTTTVTSSVNPSVFGQSVTFTATVTATGGTPTTGTVQFFDGATPIGGAIALNASSQASFTTSSLSVGNHAITATYSGATVGAGGGGFVGSNGSLTDGQEVDPANTSVGVASSDNTSMTGEVVTFTATVSPTAPGAGTPGGTVTFSQNGSPICSNVALNASSQATCAQQFNVAGNYNITASYSGSTNFNSSNNNSSPMVQMVTGPTAANANVSGRVVDAGGRGVPGARITMQSQGGDVLWAITNPFGYFRFTGVPTGQSYLVSVGHKRFTFSARTVDLAEDLTDLVFVAESRSGEGEQPVKSRGPVRSP